MRRLPVLLALLFSLTATAADYQLETIAEDFDYPWCVAFLPDGDLLVTELGGNVIRLSADGASRVTLTGVPAVYRASQGGLFDILPDRNFAANRTVYLSYAQGTADDNGTAVASATLGATGLSNVQEIFRVANRKDTPAHYGGRIVQLADGTLLLSTGDGFDYREAAQNIGSQLGKVIRINTDGTPARGNPFPDAPYVFSYGHRNPQGLVVRADGTILMHEHGPRGGDELNIVVAGHNYGWPAITYGLDYSGAYVSPYTQWPGMEQPLHYWVPSIAPSGMALYQGALFPDWRGDLFIGALVDWEVRRLQMRGDKVVKEEAMFGEIDARIRDVRSSPDGYLYIVTDGEAGKVIRVSPTAQ